MKQGDQAIRAWFAERDEGVVPLNEVKVILVGDGEAGKTTLRKRLMGLRPDPKESQTHGIEIHRSRPVVSVVGHGQQHVGFADGGGIGRSLAVTRRVGCGRSPPLGPGRRGAGRTGRHRRSERRGGRARRGGTTTDSGDAASRWHRC